MTESSTALSISDLHRRVRTKIALEFRGLIWVTGEIRTMNDGRSGHCFLSLVEPGSFADGSDMTLDAVCWRRQWALASQELSAAGTSLGVGTVVRLYGQVSLSKKNSVQLEVNKIDVDALVGRQAAEKKRLLAALDSDGLLERQRQLEVPMMPLRIGLVTSRGSEGMHDFLGQLERSSYGFSVSLAHAPVQGPAAPNAVAAAIETLNLDRRLDLVAVVRGGGGELDAFDKEVVARAIATSRSPVWTGIGHTGDHSIADDVSQANFITPTACGQGIVARVDDYNQRVLAAIDRLRQAVSHRLHAHELRTHQHSLKLAHSAERVIHRSEVRIEAQQRELAKAVARLPEVASARLETNLDTLRRAIDRRCERLEDEVGIMRKRIAALDPRAALLRGYSLTRTSDGTLVRSVADIGPGSELVTDLADGSICSSVRNITVVEEQK